MEALELIGFATVSQRGSHRKLRHHSGKIVTVPMHDELALGIEMKDEIGHRKVRKTMFEIGPNSN